MTSSTKVLSLKIRYPVADETEVQLRVPLVPETEIESTGAMSSSGMVTLKGSETVPLVPSKS